jgi:hypothetical protein
MTNINKPNAGGNIFLNERLQCKLNMNSSTVDVSSDFHVRKWQFV